MRSYNKMYTKASIVFAMIACMRTVSFAGNTIGDVPTSASENRTIQTATSLYTDTCDISQDLGFYAGSPAYLRVAQPKGAVSYVFDKTATYVIIYGADILGQNMKFPYISNFVPSTTLDPGSSNILTVDLTGAIFSGGLITTSRNQTAVQIVTKNEERSIIANTNGASLNYYYKRSNDMSSHNGSMKVSINPNLTIKTSCTNYYVARCGDGIIDKASGSSDGNGGITTQAGTFLPRHSRSVKPDEQCDDGSLNGTPGHCKIDCTGIGSGTTPGTAGCNISASASSIEAGQSVTINASYTSGASATLTPTLSGMPAFTSPDRNGSTTDAPASTTTYTLNVQGMSGVNDNSCSTTVTVTQPVPHLQCTLTLSPSIAGVNQPISVGRNVSNGNFFGTYIYVTPALIGAWPHRVNANQYNGVSTVMPTQTGDYVFSMLINNNTESAQCTGVLHIVDDVAPCSLTTATPTISLGDTAILNGSYTNGVLANITPYITGINFIYPTRSNTNIPVSPTETTTYTLNVVGINGGSGAACSTTVHVRNTGLDISKELVTNVLYHSGDLVVFKINFANNSSGIIHNIILSDTLPLSLEYASSQLFGVNPPYHFGTGMLGGYQVVEYSGFSLNPGQQGYLLVSGKFKGYNYLQYMINNAFIQGDDTDLKHAAVGFSAYAPTTNTTVTKTSDESSYFPGEDARFTIAVTNNGPDTISNVIVTDDRPNTSCITPDTQRSSTMPLTMSATTDPYQWTYNGSLAVGQTIYLYITGHISNNTSCLGTYINNANIAYTINGSTQTGSATPLQFTVSTTPSSTMNFEKRLVSYGSKSGDPVVFELLYQNNGTATITNYDIMDYRPGTLNFVSASPMPTTQSTTSGGMELHRIFSSLAPNGSGKITINGTIK